MDLGQLSADLKKGGISMIQADSLKPELTSESLAGSQNLQVLLQSLDVLVRHVTAFRCQLCRLLEGVVDL